MPVSCGVMLVGTGSSGGAPGIGPPLRRRAVAARAQRAEVRAVLRGRRRARARRARGAVIDAARDVERDDVEPVEHLAERRRCGPSGMVRSTGGTLRRYEMIATRSASGHQLKSCAGMKRTRLAVGLDAVADHARDLPVAVLLADAALAAREVRRVQRHRADPSARRACRRDRRRGTRCSRRATRRGACRARSPPDRSTPRWPAARTS